MIKEIHQLINFTESSLNNMPDMPRITLIKYVVIEKIFPVNLYNFAATFTFQTLKIIHYRYGFAYTAILL